jgi:hypothetical protein
MVTEDSSDKLSAVMECRKIQLNIQFNRQRPIRKELKYLFTKYSDCKGQEKEGNLLLSLSSSKPTPRPIAGEELSRQD